MAEKKTKRIGVLLCGCGKADGSEVHEATLTLLHISRSGHKAVCIAPNDLQKDVVNHLNGKPMPEQRQMLVEAARIARGDVQDLAGVQDTDLDALIFPGGFGAAKNLFDFALKGPEFSVRSDVQKLIEQMHARKKPLGFICIAPLMAARVLGKNRPKLTLGPDGDVVAVLERWGAVHVPCPVTQCVIDEQQRVVSAPAYMHAASIDEVSEGIEKLVKTVVAWLDKI